MVGKARIVKGLTQLAATVNLQQHGVHPQAMRPIIRVKHGINARHRLGRVVNQTGCNQFFTIINIQDQAPCRQTLVGCADEVKNAIGFWMRISTR